MTGSNLPPGVTVSMIPGNRPEDFALEAAEEALLDGLAKFGLMVDEYQVVLDVGIAAVKAARALSMKDCEDLRREVKELNDHIESKEKSNDDQNKGAGG